MTESPNRPEAGAETAPETGEEPAWSQLLFGPLRTPLAGRRGLVSLAGACAIVAVAAALIDRPGQFGFDGWPLFYGVLGASTALVTGLLARALGPLLRGAEEADSLDNPSSSRRRDDV